MKKVIVTEVQFVVSRPARGRRWPVQVAVESVDAQDRPMARALARVLEVWLNAARRAA